MGNICCCYGRWRHRGSKRGSNQKHPPSPPPPLQPQTKTAATPYPPQYPNPNSNPHPPYYQNPVGPYYPPPPPLTMDPAASASIGGRYPCGPMMHALDHQKAVAVRNDVNLKKETLKIEADQQNPGKFLVSFTFDACVACRITLYSFVKEGDDCNLTTTREKSGPPITVSFEQGLGQMFRQTSGTGIDFSAHEEAELLKGQTDVYPLAVKAEVTPGVAENGNTDAGVTNSQITLAVFVKDKGEYQVRVMKQILWVNGMRYELQEILGIGNLADGNDPGKECVVCLSEPRDTTVLAVICACAVGVLKF